MTDVENADVAADSTSTHASAAGAGAGGPNVPVRVLVVDDEPAVRTSLERALRLDGYAVATAADGMLALDSILVHPPDLLVLDVMMPRLGGLELCRRLRSAGDDTPILVVTAKDSVSDRVAGLDAGADDYLVKPFALAELLARVRALLRRSGGGEDPDSLGYSDLTLDTASRDVRRSGRSVELTRTEFSLLELFLRNPERVLPRDLILDRVWGYDFGPSSNSLEVFIGYLRRKTEAAGEARLIQTVRGIGYVLREG
ncbi:MAG: response regulator transcription factor [Actinomycetes bacterium]